MLCLFDGSFRNSFDVVSIQIDRVDLIGFLAHFEEDEDAHLDAQNLTTGRKLPALECEPNASSAEVARAPVRTKPQGDRTVLSQDPSERYDVFLWV